MPRTARVERKTAETQIDLQLNLDRARRWHPLNRSLYVGARVMLPGQPIRGSVTSSTVTVKVQVLLRPLSLVAVLVTVVTPTGNTEPLAGTLTRLVMLPQTAAAVTVKVTFEVHWLDGNWTVMFAGQVIAGGV